MKKLVVLLFALITTNVFSQDFRNTSWGMKKDDVSKIETSTPQEKKQPDALNYFVNISDYDLKLQYIFNDDKLFAGSYYRDFDNNNYAESYYNQKNFFTKMFDLLNLKYGKGDLVDKENDVFVFYNSAEKKLKKYVNDDIDSFLDLNETINSIQYKHLEKNIFNLGYSYCIKYTTDSTVIILLVQQKGSEVHQEIMYMDKKMYINMNANIRKLLVKDSGL